MDIFIWILIFTSTVQLYFTLGFFKQKEIIEGQNACLEGIASIISEYEQKIKNREEE